MSYPSHGRHEFGQNFIHDRTVISAVVEAVARTDGRILEIGAGDGALTIALERLGRPLTAIEIDERRAHRLARRTGTATTVVASDFLRHHPPRGPHVVVGNLPFHQTTAILRRLLHSPDWTEAVLMVQWEVARRRAGVGGATMMTAQWWPWYEFDLIRRVPASAFRPRPGVDAGLMTMSRRLDPLIPASDRRTYQAMVHAVFTGRGRGVPDILVRRYGRPLLRKWLERNQIGPSTLPRDLTAEQWAGLHLAATRN